MWSSHVKISNFRVQAHLVLHWCLYNKFSYKTWRTVYTGSARRSWFPKQKGHPFGMVADPPSWDDVLSILTPWLAQSGQLGREWKLNHLNLDIHDSNRFCLNDSRFLQEFLPDSLFTKTFDHLFSFAFKFFFDTDSVLSFVLSRYGVLLKLNIKPY